MKDRGKNIEEEEEEGEEKGEKMKRGKEDGKEEEKGGGERRECEENERRSHYTYNSFLIAFCSLIQISRKS